MTRQRNRSRRQSSGPSRPVNRARQVQQIQRAASTLQRGANGARWGRVVGGAGKGLAATATALELLGLGLALASEAGELAGKVKPAKPKPAAKP